MKTHSSNYKSGICKIGRQIRSKITYSLNGNNIELGNAQLNSITPSVETSLLKSVMKSIEIDSNEEIPVNTVFRYQFGLKVDRYIQTSDEIYLANKDYYKYENSKYVLLVAGTDYIVGDEIETTVYEFQEYEYLDFGYYVVKEVEIQENTNSYIIKAYDKMLYAMKNYEEINIQYPCTVRDYIGAVATQIGLTFKNSSDTFVNYDKLINEDLYKNLKYTYRDVLDELSQVTASNICISSDDKLEVRYFTNTNDTIDEHYLKNINVKFGKTFGPVNTIVLSRAGESDSIYLDDAQSVEDNGRCEIKIIENQIMNFNDRDTYLPGILNQLDGLEFSICDFDSTGITYYDVCDKFNVNIGENTYQCIMLNDTLEITQGLSESIYAEEPEETNTDYNKSDKTDNRINETWIIANKQEGEITALTSRVQTTEDELGNMYTKEEVFEVVQTAGEQLTTTFSEAGGNNIFRNTGLFFENNGDDSEVNPYEFWYGKVLRDKEDKAINMSCLKLQDDTLYQDQLVPNGTYTISFKYKKLYQVANASAFINDEEIELTETEDTEIVRTIQVNSQHIIVKFECDVDNGCEVYDLMINTGSTKLAYSQNQNEVTTDTVNIGKGIEINSSQTNTKFRADSDGIRVYNKDSNEVKTKFTDTGMETEEAEIKNRAEIVKTLFQEVGDHTWITRL